MEMTNDEKRKLCEDEIKPVIIELNEKCEVAGISFLVITETDPSSFERVGNISEDASMVVKLVEAVVRSRGNVDMLITAIVEHAKKYGHSSQILVALGVPVEGEAMAKIIARGSEADN